MKKKVNPKSVHTIDATEKQEIETKKKLQTVLKDRGKMVDTIETLDQHKRDTVEKVWNKVNGCVSSLHADEVLRLTSAVLRFSDFGAIFAELLPGNFAKLQPPDGQDLMQGLEVKVRLGQVWKQSLTELSGGQR